MEEIPGTIVDNISRKRQALQCLGNGDLDAARQLFEQTCAQDTGDAEPWFMLGAISGQQGKLDEAIRCLQKAITINPDYPDALFNLGQAFMHKGDALQAAECYQKAADLSPGNRPVLCNLSYALLHIGYLYAEQGMDGPALSSIRRARTANPEDIEVCFQSALVLKKLDRLVDAASLLEQVLQKKPGDKVASQILGTLLCSQGHHRDAEICFRSVLEKYPDARKVHEGLLFVLNYTCSDREQLLEAHRECVRQCYEQIPVSGENHTAIDILDTERRLRVGYVSADFKAHSVAYFLEPLLRNRSADKTEVFCYSNVDKEDSYTARLKSLADHWRDIQQMEDDSLCQRIEDDGIDILVDLAGHTAGNRMGVFARRPAPVQVAWLGYPATTGLPAMDYRFTDSLSDPEGESDAGYVEQLVRLPDGFLCYSPPPGTPFPSSSPFLSKGFLTFGSCNNPAKMTPEVLALWGRLLSQVPNSRLVLKNKPCKDKLVREQLYERLEAVGIKRSRVELVGWAPTLADHLALYQRIDIALDTFPYNGTTTTCEAVWMGVPVITLAGKLHAGRVGVSLLTQLGLEEWIAKDTDEYVSIGRRWAASAETLSELRARLRGRMAVSSLCNGKAFAEKVESAYRAMWKRSVHHP